MPAAATTRYFLKAGNSCTQSCPLPCLPSGGPVPLRDSDCRHNGRHTVAHFAGVMLVKGKIVKLLPQRAETLGVLVACVLFGLDDPELQFVTGLPEVHVSNRR